MVFETSKGSLMSPALFVSLCASERACVCVCTCVSSPLGEMPAGAPERLGVGKETSRFCTMNDLLRQAHPNTLVPGGGRDPFCAPTNAAGAIMTCTKLAQGWMSLIHTSLSLTLFRR